MLVLSHVRPASPRAVKRRRRQPRRRTAAAAERGIEARAKGVVAEAVERVSLAFAFVVVIGSMSPCWKIAYCLHSYCSGTRLNLCFDNLLQQDGAQVKGIAADMGARDVVREEVRLLRVSCLQCLGDVISFQTYMYLDLRQHIASMNPCFLICCGHKPPIRRERILWWWRKGIWWRRR